MSENLTEATAKGNILIKNFVLEITKIFETKKIQII